jgi:glutamate N-acetyltransferase/amino-acid N-acetyltransferase
LVVNDGPPHHAAAVFTSNRVEAAPVTWSRHVVSRRARGRGLPQLRRRQCLHRCHPGFQDTHRTAEHVAEALGLGRPATSSSARPGLIGELLPMDCSPGVEAAVATLSDEGGPAAATAIMTTDTVPKDRHGASRRLERSGAWPRAPACSRRRWPRCSSSSPRMPSCRPVADDLDAVLRAATAMTFDRIDSDGCMSTNDTVLLMASGASAHDGRLDDLTAAVTEVCA